MQNARTFTSRKDVNVSEMAKGKTCGVRFKIRINNVLCAFAGLCVCVCVNTVEISTFVMTILNLIWIY